MTSVDYLRFLLAFTLVMGLIALLAFGARRLGFGNLSQTSGGKRRLRIVEMVPLDTRRRLVLVRRDDVEHLLVVGGVNDVVVETGIPAQPEERAP